MKRIVFLIINHYPIFFVILGPAILLMPALIRGETLFWGLPALQFIPWQTYTWQNLAQGQFPFLNLLNGMGSPFMANYQTAFFYPPAWFPILTAFIFGAPGLAWAQTLLVLVHLTWGGIGMALVIKRLGLGNFPQTIGALAFCLSGYFIARSNFYTMIWAGAWLPWVIKAVSEIANPLDGYVKDRSFVPFPLILCLTMQLLSGHAQLTWYTGLLAFFWVFAGGIRSSWINCIKAEMRFGLSVLVSLGISAIQLVPTAEFLLQSQRSSAVDSASGMTYSFWPWRFLTFLMPNMFGNPGTGDFWGYASFWEDATYLGAVPLVLAVLTLFLIVPKNRSNKYPMRAIILWCWAAVLIGAVFALGQNTPIFPLLYHYFPTFSLFNAPARWMVLPVFALSLLAAIGASSWKKPVGSGLVGFKRISVAAAAITMGALCAWFVLKDIQITFIASAALLGIWLTGACLFTLIRPVNGAGASMIWWELGVITFVFIDLIMAGINLQPTISSNVFGDSPGVEIAYERNGRVYLDQRDEYRLKFSRFFRFSDYRPIEDWNNLRQVVLPNINLLPGSQFEMVNNFDPLVTRRYAEYIDFIETLPSQALDRFLEMMNVGSQVLLDETLTSGVRIKNIHANGLIQFKRCGIWINDTEQVLSLLTQKVGQGENQWLADHLVLEGKYPEECFEPSSTFIFVDEDRSGYVHVEIDNDSAGFILFANVNYPGWEARIDGDKTTIFSANYLFMGLKIPEGKHIIEFRYQSKAFYIGMSITGFCLIFMLLSQLFKMKRFFSKPGNNTSGE